MKCFAYYMLLDRNSETFCVSYWYFCTKMLEDGTAGLLEIGMLIIVVYMVWKS